MFRKDSQMIEATTNPAARTAIQNAHDARGQMMAYAWRWFFGKISR